MSMQTQGQAAPETARWGVHGEVACGARAAAPASLKCARPRPGPSPVGYPGRRPSEERSPRPPPIMPAHARLHAPLPRCAVVSRRLVAGGACDWLRADGPRADWLFRAGGGRAEGQSPPRTFKWEAPLEAPADSRLC